MLIPEGKYLRTQPGIRPARGTVHEKDSKRGEVGVLTKKLFPRLGGIQQRGDMSKKTAGRLY